MAGGPGRPEGLDKGYYVRPTVFANIRESYEFRAIAYFEKDGA